MDKKTLYEKIYLLDCGHGNGCDCVARLIDDIHESFQDMRKQHQEDTRIWHTEREQLLKRIDRLNDYTTLVVKDGQRWAELYGEATSSRSRGQKDE